MKIKLFEKLHHSDANGNKDANPNSETKKKHQRKKSELKKPHKPDYPRPKAKELKRTASWNRGKSPQPGPQSATKSHVRSASAGFANNFESKGVVFTRPRGNSHPNRIASVSENVLSDDEEEFVHHTKHSNAGDSVEEMLARNDELEEEVVFLRKKIKRLETKFRMKMDAIMEDHRIELYKMHGVGENPDGERTFSRSSQVSAPVAIQISWPLMRILHNKQALTHLIAYAESKYCPEPVLFYRDCVVYDREMDNKKAYKLAEGIFRDYLTAGAEQELNVMHGERKAIAQHLGRGKNFDNGKPKDVFSKVKEESLTLMKTNVYGAFVNGDMFKEFIDNYEGGDDSDF